MKIAFVHGAYENLGVEYLSGILKKYNHQTKLFVDPQLFDDSDLSIKWLNRVFSFKETVVRDVLDYKPDIICFSVQSDFYLWACALASLIKKENAKIPIIFGGIHATSVPEYVIQNDFVDIVCVGEGEYALLELVESLKKGQIDYSIRNLWFKKDGRVIKNPLRPLIQNLDELPFPDRQLFYESSPAFISPYIFIMTSRGCLYSCSYCCNSVLRELYRNNGQYLRRRSVNNVIQEILEIKQYKKINKMSYIYFIDDLFTNDQEWLDDFCQEYTRKIRIPFYCITHPNHINEEIVRLLKKTGCFEVNMGIQTWSENIREKVLNRYISNTQIEKAINLLTEYKIKIVTDIIFGLPMQTEDEVLELAKFYNKHNIKLIHILFLRYYPRTPIVKIAKDMGILSETEVRLKENPLVGYSTTLTRGGDVLNKLLLQFKLLFVILPCLPIKLNYILIEKKIHRYFPKIPLFIMVILTNLFGNISALGYCLRKRMIKRYIIFIIKQLTSPLNSIIEIMF